MKNINNNIFVFFVVGLLLIVYYEHKKNNINNTNTNTNTNANTNVNYDSFKNSNDKKMKQEINFGLDLRLANTKNKMKVGLSNRQKPLPERIHYSGMIFDFENMGIRTMTMKDTKIPLDMIFLDNNSKIVGIIENAKPYNKKQYSINIPTRYVIEINAGLVKKLNLKVGQVIKNKYVNIITDENINNL